MSDIRIYNPGHRESSKNKGDKECSEAVRCKSAESSKSRLGLLFDPFGH